MLILYGFIGQRILDRQAAEGQSDDWLRISRRPTIMQASGTSSSGSEGMVSHSEG